MLSKKLVLSTSEMLGNSITHMSAKMKRNVGIRIKPLGPNHGISKLICVCWWLTLQPCDRIWRQTKPQNQTKLGELGPS